MMAGVVVKRHYFLWLSQFEFFANFSILIFLLRISRFSDQKIDVVSVRSLHPLKYLFCPKSTVATLNDADVVVDFFLFQLTSVFPLF